MARRIALCAKLSRSKTLSRPASSTRPPSQLLPSLRASMARVRLSTRTASEFLPRKSGRR